MKKLMLIAILFCGLMLGGCLENLSEKEYPTISLEPHTVYDAIVGTNILVQAQSERLLVSDIVVNRGNCKTRVYGAQINQERVNALIENGEIEMTKEKELEDWSEEGRRLNLYQPFELKFGEQLKIITGCRADSILEIVLKTDKGDLSYDFRN